MCLPVRDWLTDASRGPFEPRPVRLSPLFLADRRTDAPCPPSKRCILLLTRTSPCADTDAFVTQDILQGLVRARYGVQDALVWPPPKLRNQEIIHAKVTP